MKFKTIIRLFLESRSKNKFQFDNHPAAFPSFSIAHP